MTKEQLLAVRKFKHDNAPLIEQLQQNLLLTEREFIEFGRNRGIPVAGGLEGDPGKFFRRGWLDRDGVDHDGTPLFHPFRLYVVHRILATNLPTTLQTAGVAYPNEKLVEEKFKSLNGIVDLAQLLEPIYWPIITAHLSFTKDEQSHRDELALYKNITLHLIQQLDAKEWSKAHSSIRMEAARRDDNPELYLLLRLSTWEARSKLTGRISGALWFRQMAEVIRRGFEESGAPQWPEEDQATRSWRPGGRRRAFGSERPLDDEFRSKPYLAYRFGLFTGSAVRWYVEGDTEYYAVDQLLPEPNKVGIELVNLKGEIAGGKGNTALKLGEMLAQDRSLRRFSIISFDLDVRANEKVIRQLVTNDCVIGSIAGNWPDFEFANFTVQELAEIAARIDDSHGFSGDKIRQENWAGIEKGRDFEANYVRISERKASSLKGEEWGRALATYATQNLRRGDGNDRPLWNEISAAIYSWNSNYDHDVFHFRLDPATFARVRRS